MKYALFLSLILLSATASALCLKPYSPPDASDPQVARQLQSEWQEYQDCREQERADRQLELDRQREQRENQRNLERQMERNQQQ
jgi:hypothetical protein